MRIVKYNYEYRKDNSLDKAIRNYGIRKICMDIGEPQAYSLLSKALKGNRSINEDLFEKIRKRLTK